MGLEDLTELQIIQGFLGIITLSVIIIVGILICLKYFTYKRIELMTIGLNLIAVTNSWWGTVSAFILYAFFDMEITDVQFMLITYTLLPLASILWLYSFGHIIYPKSKWKIVSIWIVISVVYEILFIYYIINDPSAIAIRITRFDTITQGFTALYIMLALLTTIISYTIFLIKSLKSVDAKNRLKGKFIYIGTMLFIIVAIIDSSFPVNTLIAVISRCIFITCAIMGYIGWIMPDRVSRLFLKEEE